jgi:hypothetical protein
MCLYCRHRMLVEQPSPSQANYSDPLCRTKRRPGSIGPPIFPSASCHIAGDLDVPPGSSCASLDDSQYRRSSAAGNRCVSLQTVEGILHVLKSRRLRIPPRGPREAGEELRPREEMGWRYGAADDKRCCGRGVARLFHRHAPYPWRAVVKSLSRTARACGVNVVGPILRVNKILANLS